MDEIIRTVAISPLRQRLIDHMNLRRFSRETQRNYIRDVGRFANTLAGANARLGADADRYSFTVVDLHHLLPAGFDRRTVILEICTVWVWWMNEPASREGS